MYNSIYPVNINYTNRNQYRNSNGSNSAEQNPVDYNQKQGQDHNTFPNGNKVAIDYSKGQINISQVLTDFRSTILAINAPDDVRDEVYTYLNLVDKESHKENPSREIVVANLKNASRVSDSFIAQALKKPSNVVQKWIETLFLQKINLKADENEINPDFQLEFPKKAQENIDAHLNVQPKEQQNAISLPNKEDEQIKIADDSQPKKVQQEELESEVGFELSDKTVVEELSDSIPQETAVVEEVETFETQNQSVALDKKQTYIHSAFSPKTQADTQARNLFIQAKNMPETNQGDVNAINLLNEALGIISKAGDANKNIKAAIHIERGKIFDNYDYVDYALRDYYEATKADDYNLKAQAHYKSGQIYDEFSEFLPAMDNYLSSVAYSAEADNLDAQSRVLSKISGLYTRQYDIQNALQYGDLAIEMANNSTNDELIAKTYSQDAQNSQYLGENDRAMDSYKNALKTFSRKDESYSQMAYNYEQAAIVMRKLGNHAKAGKLQLKANLYHQKAQLQQSQLAEVS